MSKVNKSAAAGMVQHIGGTAVVCCIHQVEKRAKVALFNGDRPDGPGHDYAHVCSCCENMFISKSSEPRFCDACGGRPLPGLPEGVRV